MSKPSDKTDMSDLLGQLNAGVFEQQVNRVMSDLAANVVTHRKKGKVVPTFTIRYSKGDRETARLDAMRHARRLLEAEFARQVGRILDCVRADIYFEDDEGKECERLLGGGHWVPISFAPEEHSCG